MMNNLDNITDLTDFGIKGGVLICNALAYVLLDASNGLDLIDKGGVIALLLLVTFALWKMVQSKDKTIKKVFEDRLKDKDTQIQFLKDKLK